MVFECDVRIVNGDITDMPCQVMVNAANGIGYMGGRRCTNRLCKGVAEHMQYVTQGAIENEARMKVKEKGLLRPIIGLNPGDYYITDSCGLPCKYVFHAVTMRFPGSRSKAIWIKKCLINLKNFCVENELFDIALPYIGCGNGNVNKTIVRDLIAIIFHEPWWHITIVDYIAAS